MSSTVVALSKCRVCLNVFGNNELHSLFSQNEYFVEYLNADLVMACSSIQISKDDGYPQNICQYCYQKLSQLYKFRQLCEHSNKILHDTVQVLNADVKCEITHEVFIDDVKHEDEECHVEDDLDCEFNVATDCGTNETQNVEISTGNIACNICNINFTSRGTLKLHNLRNHELSCQKCSKTFEHNEQLLEHIVEVHKLYSYKYKRRECPLCQNVYYNLAGHHTQVHNSNNRCPTCDKLFVTYKHFLKHMQNGCRAVKTHLTCPYCERKFADTINLNKHVRLHTSEKRYACDFCPKQFVQKCYLKLHRQVHTGEKNYACEICGRRFRHRSNLKGHLLSHSDERNFACKLCDKKFKQPRYLKQHMDSHAGAKKHKCDLCDKRFAVKQNLTIHRRHHTGERPYACELCTKSFTKGPSLRTHMKSKHNK